MEIVRDDSQQTTAHINLVGNDGNRRTAVSVTCHIRPSKGATISVDVLDGTSLDAASMSQVRATIAAYLAEEIEKAATLGVPIALPVRSE